MEMLGLIRLADFVGVDTFLTEAARWLDVSVDAIANHNAVRNVHQLVRGRYRASRHNKEKGDGICVWCSKPIRMDFVVPCRPQVEERRRSPCNNKPVPGSASLALNVVIAGGF